MIEITLNPTANKDFTNNRLVFMNLEHLISISLSKYAFNYSFLNIFQYGSFLQLPRNVKCIVTLSLDL